VALQVDVIVREGGEEPGQRRLVLVQAASRRPESRDLQSHVSVEELHSRRHVLPALGDGQRLRQLEHPMTVHTAFLQWSLSTITAN
jgi:hypothetical protein